MGVAGIRVSIIQSDGVLDIRYKVEAHVGRFGAGVIPTRNILSESQQRVLNAAIDRPAWANLETRRSVIVGLIIDVARIARCIDKPRETSEVVYAYLTRQHAAQSPVQNRSI